VKTVILGLQPGTYAMVLCWMTKNLSGDIDATSLDTKGGFDSQKTPNHPLQTN
jgi:hypothetical protein